MRHTITLAAAPSNLKGNFTEWTNYFLGTGFGAFAKNVLGLASGVVLIASAPATGGMILAPIDKGVDFLTGIAENKL